MKQAIVAAALFVAVAAHAFGGIVTRVSDGDTLWVQPDDRSKRRVKLRLADIDAPERCQAWGGESRRALASRVLHRAVEVRTRSRDDYGRALGSVLHEGEDIAGWLVASGHAWSTRWRGRPTRYAAQEQAARAGRRGLFAQPSAVEPWRFRSAHGPCK